MQRGRRHREHVAHCADRDRGRDARAVEQRRRRRVQHDRHRVGCGRATGPGRVHHPHVRHPPRQRTRYSVDRHLGRVAALDEVDVVDAHGGRDGLHAGPDDGDRCAAIAGLHTRTGSDRERGHCPRDRRGEHGGGAVLVGDLELGVRRVDLLLIGGQLLGGDHRRRARGL